MRIRKLAFIQIIDDAKVSKLAMHANFVGALIVLVLGIRYVSQLATTPIEMLLGIVLLLMLCLALIGLGVLQHIASEVKALREELQRRDSRD